MAFDIFWTFESKSFAATTRLEGEGWLWKRLDCNGCHFYRMDS